MFRFAATVGLTQQVQIPVYCGITSQKPALTWSLSHSHFLMRYLDPLGQSFFQVAWTPAYSTNQCRRSHAQRWNCRLRCYMCLLNGRRSENCCDCIPRASASPPGMKSLPTCALFDQRLSEALDGHLIMFIQLSSSRQSMCFTKDRLWFVQRSYSIYPRMAVRPCSISTMTAAAVNGLQTSQVPEDSNAVHFFGQCST